MTERMTDEQVRAAVAALRVTEADRAAILTAALAGDQGARLAVYFYRRVQAGRRVTIRTITEEG